jgi:hypothetical protein
MKNNIIEDYKKLTKDDKQEAQNRNFDMWREELEQKIQMLYDKIILGCNRGNGSEDINEYIPEFEEKAILDLIYVNLQIVLEDGEELLNKKQR